MRIIVLIAILTCGMAITLWYPENPPVAHTGGFGEPTCHACHFDGAVNDELGVLSIAGLDATYVPGQRYTLSVVLVRPGLQEAGFQLSIRTDDGEQAGAIQTSSERVGIDRAKGIEYVRHSPRGTGGIVSDSSLWTFHWAAPEDSIPVHLHVVANAANGDESEFGDAIYQKALLITASRNGEAVRHR